MEEILSKLYEMTAFGGFSYQVALMWIIAFVLLYQIGRASCRERV